MAHFFWFSPNPLANIRFRSTGIREASVATSSSSVPSTPASVVAPKSSADIASFPGRKMTQKGSQRNVEILMNDADDNKYGRQTILDKIGIRYVIARILSSQYCPRISLTPVEICRPMIKRVALMQQTPGFNRRVGLGIAILAFIFIVVLIVSSLKEEEDMVKIS